MSSMDPPLHERVYEGLKEDFLAGRFLPGKKIDIQELATRHRASKTPVREAAFIMVGEGLFTHHADGGFLVPILEPKDIIDLLTWHMQMMLSLLANLRESAMRNALQQSRIANESLSAVSVANQATHIFASLATATGNRQAAYEVRRLNERLHYSRIAEAKNPVAQGRELATIASLGVENLPKAVRRRIETYHLRKIDHLRELSSNIHK